MPTIRISRDQAEKLVALLLDQSRDLNAVLIDLQAATPADEFASCKSIVGRILGEIYVAALYPIFETYPDLKPPGFL